MQPAKEQEAIMQIKSGYWVAIGLAIGGLVGVLLDNIPVYAGAGLAIGAALAAWARRQEGQ